MLFSTIKKRLSLRKDALLCFCPLKQVALARLIFFLFGWTVLPTVSHAQRSIIQKTTLQLQRAAMDTNRVKLLIKMGNEYIELIKQQPQLGDSALYYAEQAAALSNKLKYEDGLNDAAFLKVAALITMKLQEHNKGNAALLQKAELEQQQLIKRFETQGKPDKTAELYMKLADFYGEDYNHRKNLYEQALPLYRRLKNKKGEADALENIGYSYMQTGNFKKSTEYFLESLSINRSIGRRDIHLYRNLCTAYTFLGNYNTGLQYGLEAEKIAESLKDTSSEMIYLYYYMGVTYEVVQDWPNAIKYFKKALQAAQRFDDESRIISMASSVSKVLSVTNHADESTAFMKDIVKRYAHHITPVAAARINVRFMINYMKFGEFSKAQPYCDTLMAFIRTQPDSSLTTGAIFSPVLQFLVRSKQYDSVRKYLPIYENIVRRTGTSSYWKEIELRWFQIDSAQGQYFSAIRHYQRYYAVNDSLYNVGKAKEFSELQVKYETEKKDRELTLKEQSIALLEKDKQLQLSISQKQQQDLALRAKDIELLNGEKALQLAEKGRLDKDIRLKDQNLQLQERNIALLKSQGLLQQANLQKTETTRNIIIGGAAVLLLLLGLVYSRYRIKQRTALEISAKNQALEQLVSEKEWLLKEIHHRVKNNLHTITSLLESQAAYVQDGALAAIRDSQHRVHAMSLIHQKLYQSDNVATINLAVFIRELVAYLDDFFDTRPRVRFRIEADAVELDVSQAAPLGLILNEAITNAVKYAFPDGREGIIQITLKELPDSFLQLAIQDNGIGLPEHFDIYATRSLGMKLMKGLSEDFDAEFTITGEQGTTVSLRFKIDTFSTRMHPHTTPANLERA